MDGIVKLQVHSGWVDAGPLLVASVPVILDQSLAEKFVAEWDEPLTHIKKREPGKGSRIWETDF